MGRNLAAGGGGLKGKWDMVKGRFRVGIARVLACLICVLLAFAPICSVYADGGGGSHNFDTSYPNFGTVWFDNKGVGGVAHTLGVRYGVVAFTQYDAAVYCCKGSNFDFGNLSAKKKQKLLANSKFTAFANLFSVGKPAATDDWSSDAEITLAWNKARELYGETYCYSGIYTVDGKLEVQEIIDNILKEDDTDEPTTGGDAVVVGSTTYIPVVEWADGFVGDVSFISVANSNFGTLQSYADAHDYKIYGYLYEGGYNSTTLANQYKYYTYIIFTCPPDNITYNDDYSISFNEGFTTPIVKGYTSKPSSGNWDKNLKNVQIDGTYYKAAYCGSYYEDRFFSAGLWTTSVLSDKVWTNAPIYYASEFEGFGGGGGSGGDDPDPDPPTWPTPPVTDPDPPEVPTPGDPTVEPNPDPPTPTPPTPWEPIPDIDIDITGEDFQDLIDALEEHCKHLQQAIQSNISQLWDLQSDFLGSQFSDLFTQLGDNFSWLGNDVIVASFGDLKSYLKELFDWLSERMDFNVSVEGGQYDDTSIIYWVKQIWSKLGDGINTRPVDPNIDTDGWWDWISGLLSGLVGSLADIGSDKIGGLVDALDTLREKFPFCIPWDIAALLGLLVSEPVTPVVQVPLMALSVSNGVQEVGTMDIDLSTYNNAWEAVRWIERIAFCVYLATRTKDFLDLLGKIKG